MSAEGMPASQPSSAMPEQRLLDAQTLAQLRGLEVHAHQIVEGYLSGQHRSPFQGFSVEFAEHREYSPGDDLRYLDWKVYGKSDRFYLKRFEEETNLVCHLLVDSSESMTYASQGSVTKFEYASRLAAAIALLVLRQQDSIAAATFDNEPRQMLRPSSTPLQLAQLCRILEAAPHAARSDLGQALQSLAERITRRGLIIVFSDFFDDLDRIAAGLRQFRRHRHEVLLVQVLDPAEADFPFQEPTLFQGLEAWGDQPGDPRALRRSYLEEFQRFCQGLSAAARAMGMRWHQARTDVPAGAALRQILGRGR